MSHNDLTDIFNPPCEVIKYADALLEALLLHEFVSHVFFTQSLTWNIEDCMTSDTKCNTTLHLWINKEALTNRHIPTLTLNKKQILEQISYDTTHQQLSKPLVEGSYSNQARRGFSAFTARHQKKSTRKQT